MASPLMCFFCDQNPRLDGDFMCKSCKEEHPFCYECGEKKRNHPFKLCTDCYTKQRTGRVVAGLAKLTVTTDDGSTTDSAQKATSQPSCILFRLKSDQNTYKEIEEHFKKEWVKVTSACPKPPPLSAIYAIQNKKLVDEFHQYGEQLRKTAKSSNSDLFFHGTKLNCDLLKSKDCCDDATCGVCGISQKGFDKDLIGSNIQFQRFGKGIYLAPNSSKCHDYTQGNPDYGVRAQVLCLVACGAKYVLMRNNTKLESPPENFHSVHGKAAAGSCLNYDEIVVFQPEAVLPQYVVVYELNGVDKIAK